MPSLSEKEAYLLVQEISPEGYASGLVHLQEPKEVDSLREEGTESSGHNLCTLPLPSSNLLVSSRKELTHLSCTLIFVAAVRGDLYISWLW